MQTSFLTAAGEPKFIYRLSAAMERVEWQASRALLASIQTRLAELDRFWETEQAKAKVEVFMLDEVHANLPPPHAAAS